MSVIQNPLPIFDEPCVEIDNLLERTSIPKDKLGQILRTEDPWSHFCYVSMLLQKWVGLRLIDLMSTTSAAELNSFGTELTRTDFRADRLKEQVLITLIPMSLVDHGFGFHDLPA